MDNKKLTGLDTLLDLNNVIIDQGDGYWVKFDVSDIALPYMTGMVRD